MQLQLILNQIRYHKNSTYRKAINTLIAKGKEVKNKDTMPP